MARRTRRRRPRSTYSRLGGLGRDVFDFSVPHTIGGLKWWWLAAAAGAYYVYKSRQPVVVGSTAPAQQVLQGLGRVSLSTRPPRPDVPFYWGGHAW